MRKTQTIQVIGIGNFNIYPIKEDEKEYNKINSNGVILEKIKTVEGIPAKYVYKDPDGKEYDNKEVFVDFNGIKLQSIKQTENVKKFEIVDKTEIYNLTEYNLSLLSVDETTSSIFDSKVGNNAIRFTLKKSSIGFSFWKAYILKMNNQMVMITGKGDLLNSIEKFKSIQKSKDQSEVIFTKLEVKAEDLEIEI